MANGKPIGIIRPEIQSLSAYHVQEATGMVKLDAMENPFAFPEHLRAGLADALAGASLNRYPSAEATDLKAAIRQAMHVPDSLDILLGNGSDEIIQLIALAVARPGAALLSVEPAFVMFRMIATFCGLRYVGVPLREDFSLDAGALMAAIRTEQPAVIFLAYPNNPTGNLFDRSVLREVILEAATFGGLVVIDEAYFAFSRATFLDEIANHANAVLMRTVSKLGLAGVRLGMLIGRRQWLAEFDKLRLPYNINALTQAAAGYAMRHYPALIDQAAMLVNERARLAASLGVMPRVQCFASDANFVLIRVPDAAIVFKQLLSRRILVKNTSHTHPLLANTLRLTVGTPAENDQLIAALQDLLAP